MEKVEARLSMAVLGTIDGGRLVLLLSVLFAVRTFYLSVFSLPQEIQKRLDGITRKFLLSRPR